jgi:3'-5' exoribonuclease 1
VPTFICCDLEGTCWDSGPLRDRQRQETEIIEIGAVRLDERFGVVDTFQHFVRPTRHPALTPFCMQLTSITQDDVDAAPELPVAMAAFRQWIGDPDAVLVSWGDYDRNQIRRDCLRWNVPLPLILDTHINARDEFGLWCRGQKKGRHGRGLRAAVEELGLTFAGNHHRALDDARNLAQVFAHIRDPAHMSPEAAVVLDVARARGDRGTHVGHIRNALQESASVREAVGHAAPRTWWRRAQAELLRLDLVEELADGRGLVPR